MVYMPPAGSIWVSRKPPPVPKSVGVTSVEPSGFRIERFREQQGELPIVTPLALRLTRRPATPAKVSLAFWPGTGPTVTLTGGPPGVRSEEHTSELQSRENLVCRLLLEK